MGRLDRFGVEHVEYENCDADEEPYFRTGLQREVAVD